jgi:hypothetical protein
MQIEILDQDDGDLFVSALTIDGTPVAASAANNPTSLGHAVMAVMVYVKDHDAAILESARKTPHPFGEFSGDALTYRLIGWLRERFTAELEAKRVAVTMQASDA